MAGLEPQPQEDEQLPLSSLQEKSLSHRTVIGNLTPTRGWNALELHLISYLSLHCNSARQV